ncbi:ATP synthase F1 subunit delta [bacterium]|nr:ATP synthase F1 subunit delta [bacterium]
MKIIPKQYALSLYESVIGKSKAEIKQIMKNFAGILVANNDIAKTDKIISEFDKVWNKEQGIVEAEIISARKLEKQSANMLNKYICKLSGAKIVNVKETQDKNLLGGVVLKYGDKVMDVSMKTKLSSLKEAMKK